MKAKTAGAVMTHQQPHHPEKPEPLAADKDRSQGLPKLDGGWRIEGMGVVVPGRKRMRRPTISDLWPQHVNRVVVVVRRGMGTTTPRLTFLDCYVRKGTTFFSLLLKQVLTEGHSVVGQENREEQYVPEGTSITGG